MARGREKETASLLAALAGDPAARLSRQDDGQFILSAGGAMREVTSAAVRALLAGGCWPRRSRGATSPRRRLKHG